MRIKHTDNGAKGKFFIEQDGEILAKLSYVWEGNKIVIEHTHINEALAGQGIGSLLMRKVVEFARDNGIKVIPGCEFAIAVFEKTPAYNDVLF